MTEGGVTFLVIFNTRQELSGSFNGPVKISPHTEKYMRFFKGEWLVGESQEQIDLVTGCSHGNGKDNKICILGLLLTYNTQTGFLTLAKEDLNLSKVTFPSLNSHIIGSPIAHVEWPSEHIFQLAKVIGYLPCNVKWSNVLRFDPSNEEGKCLHFTASSKGTIFVIFAAVPNNKNTWYYVQISPYGVGIFKVSLSVLLITSYFKKEKIVLVPKTSETYDPEPLSCNAESWSQRIAKEMYFWNGLQAPNQRKVITITLSYIMHFFAGKSSSKKYIYLERGYRLLVIDSWAQLVKARLS